MVTSELESMAREKKTLFPLNVYTNTHAPHQHRNVPYLLLVTSGRIALSVPELPEKLLALARAPEREAER